jgi:hypothetical protein
VFAASISTPRLYRTVYDRYPIYQRTRQQRSRRSISYRGDREVSGHQSLATAQEKDTELRGIVNSGTSGTCVTIKEDFPDHDVEMYCDVSGDTVRPKLLRTFPPWDTHYAKPGDDAFRLAVDNQRLLELVTTMSTM